MSTRAKREHQIPAKDSRTLSLDLIFQPWFLPNKTSRAIRDRVFWRNPCRIEEKHPTYQASGIESVNNWRV